MEVQMSDTLSDFLTTTRDTREYKRALAVQMVLTGLDTETIMTQLSVSRSFISKWKFIYLEQGVDALRMGYQGSKGYLTNEQREQTITWLRAQESWSVPALQTYVRETFGVEYQSLQSYYDLLHAAGLSWKKSQPRNQKKNDAVVTARRQEITDYLDAHWDEILRGDRIVLYADECFVLSGDVCGYVWGKRNERVTISIENIRDRQPYYGAINPLTGSVHVVPYDTADSLSTIDFLLDLQMQFPDTNLTIMWDNASHHRSADVQAYLAPVNAGLDESDWRITCLHFAPHDPSQNPIEDIWNQAKAFVRQNWATIASFLDVTTLFEQFVSGTLFDFPKLHRYSPDLQMI
jgi:putative transposase